MKKTLSINLNGRVFNIDEDAYTLLENYLSNLKSYFGKEADATEIISDIEARVEELFSEKIKSGYEVISIEEVEAVIKRMGSPEDLGDGTAGAEKENAASDNPKEHKTKKKFYRNVDDKKLGGVCSGISAYFGWDTLPVRLVFFILIFASTGWLLLFYLLLWILMPAALTASQKLEMKGEPVTLENIGKTVSETIASVKTNEVESFLSSVFKICMIVCGCIIGFPLLIAFFVLLFVLMVMIFGFGSVCFFGFDWIFMDSIYPAIGIISLIIMIGIPLFSIIYSVFFNGGKTSSSKTKWIVFLIWIIAFVTFLFAGAGFAKQFNFDKFWEYRITTEESGSIIERNEDLPDFQILKLDDNLIADVKIRQEIGTQAKMRINGYENMVDKIAWKIEDKKLVLYAKNNYRLKNRINLTIFITIPEIKGVVVNSFGRVTTENKIKTSGFEVKIDGAGSFYADSLYCASVSCDLEGAGKITVGGEAQSVRLSVEGVGEIDAENLEALNVHAQLEGIGTIKCYPVDFLDASIEGVGKIVYKNEPKNKKLRFNGVGKISLK